MKELTAHVTKSTKIIIKSQSGQLDEKIIAVNWFDTRIGWLYNIYNLLAARSVFKVGGQPLFKGKIIEDITGRKGRRDLLLIVRYPNAVAFKTLVESTYFKVVSLLRINAVKRFTFSFTQPYLKPKFKIKRAHYLIHHFTSDTDMAKPLESILKEEQNIEIIYSGSSFAYLFQKNEKGEKQVPAIVDNIAIYSSDERSLLVDYINSENYKNQFVEGQFGYAGLLKRIF